MKQFTTTIPGYRMNEYLLILSPHDDLKNRLMTIKKDFNEEYKTSNNTGTKPHIGLVKFFTWNMMEEKIVQRLQYIAMGITPFKIELKDFGSFPSHSIYVNVVTKVPINNLIKDIRSMQRLMKAVPDLDPHFFVEPNILIARQLKPWQYEKAWLEYSNRHFTGRFIADSMLLLKRQIEGKGYEILRRFEFMNLPVSTKQGALFM